MQGFHKPYFLLVGFAAEIAVGSLRHSQKMTLSADVRKIRGKKAFQNCFPSSISFMILVAASLNLGFDASAFIRPVARRWACTMSATREWIGTER
ncbi:hypothetical protein [Mesorhizobium australicum]|uniref:hypothetical protein n=1 Tax=Mesorhizobium australicum TaxID=536018 RepID=UPI00333B733D